MAASTLYDADETDKRAVHKLMTQRVSTAEKYYMIDNLNVQAERGAMVLRRNLNLSESTDTPSSDHTGGLTKKQLEDIDVLFAEVIQTNGPLTMSVTRNYMSESVELITMVGQHAMEKKVYDRVTYLKKKQSPLTLAMIKETQEKERTVEWLSDHNSTPASDTLSLTRSRIKWNPQDQDMIAEAFREFDKCPKKAVIEEVFKYKELLQDVLTRNTFSRCLEKVKNLFKKWKRDIQ